MLKLTFIAFCCLTNVSVAAEADESAATSIADILNNAQMVDGKLAFDKPQFDKVVQKAMATEEGWGEIVAAMELPTNNIDILYNTIRWTQKADKRQAFYEWALTKNGIK